MTNFFASIRATTWPVIGLTVLTYFAATLFANAVLGHFVFGSIYVATGSLIQATLVGGVLVLSITLTVILAIGKLRLKDVGWRLPDLSVAVPLTLAFWMATQLAFGVLAAATGTLSWHPMWTQAGLAAAIGSLVGQLLGNALAEETVFRGFLFPQMYLRTAERLSQRSAMLCAAVGGSFVFAVSHFPNRILVQKWAGADLLWDQLGLLLFGLLFIAIYMVTRNIFFATGLHAILNEPFPLVRLPNRPAYYAVWLTMTMLFLAGFWLVRATRSSRIRSGEKYRSGQA